jgi:hypothetical protein
MKLAIHFVSGVLLHLFLLSLPSPEPCPYKIANLPFSLPPPRITTPPARRRSKPNLTLTLNPLLLGSIDAFSRVHRRLCRRPPLSLALVLTAVEKEICLRECPTRPSPYRILLIGTARTGMISLPSSSVPKHPYPTTLPLLRQAAYARERLGEEHERAESERDGRILDETWGVTASGRAYGRGGEYRSCGLRHERAVRPRITLLTL